MKKLSILFVFVVFASLVQAQTRKTTKSATRKVLPVEQQVVGRHMLSLQWISWDYFGVCDIKRAADGTLTCKGEQLSKENDDYLRLNGTIEIVDAKHLRFTGTIATRIDHINGGEECLREGTFDFIATGNRRYWRMQPVENPCDGCADYVDIYFKR